MTETKQRRRRRGGKAAPVSAPVAPFIQRNLSYFDPLDEAALLKLEAQVDWLLENIGIEYRDDPEALEIWRQGPA